MFRLCMYDLNGANDAQLYVNIINAVYKEIETVAVTKDQPEYLVMFDHAKYNINHSAEDINQLKNQYLSLDENSRLSLHDLIQPYDTWSEIAILSGHYYVERFDDISEIVL